MDIERHRRRQRNRFHAWHHLQRGHHTGGESPVLRRVCTAPRQVVGRQQQAVGTEPGIGVAFLEALEEQPRDDEYEQRQCHLGGHQRLPEWAACRPAGPCAHRLLRIQPRHEPGRRRGGQHRRQQAQAHRNCQPDQVDLRLKTNGQRPRDVARAQGLRSPYRQQNTPSRTGKRQHQRLYQDQAADARARSTQRQPDPELPLTDTRAGQQQVRGVAADGRQHQQHQGLQQGERGAEHALGPSWRTGERRELRAKGLVGFGIENGELAHHGIQLALRCGMRHVGPKPAHHDVAALRPILELARTLDDHVGHRGWQPHVKCQAERRALKSLWGHADHCEHLAVDAQRRANGRRRAPETCLPVIVRDHDDRPAPRCRHVFWRQEPAHRRPQIQGLEVVAGDEEPAGTLHP